MDQEYIRRLARRCRELMGRTTSDRTREQLCLWAAEFDARAANWEAGGDASGAGNPEVGGGSAPPLGPNSPYPATR